jgi:short-subunit dehydrogenase
VDRDATGLACLSEEARQTCGERLKTFAVDLSQDNVEDLLGAVQARCGAVEVLINNAGIGQGQIKSDYHVRSPRFYEVSDALVSPVE